MTDPVKPTITRSVISDGVKTVQTIRRSDGRVLNTSVFTDKNGDGTFDANELNSVTVFGYSGNKAFSRTYNDSDGDGFYDGTITDKYYNIDQNGKMEEIKKLRSETDAGSPENIRQEIELNKKYGESIEGYKLSNLKNDTSGTFGRELIDVKQMTNPGDFK